jgi:membrane associated rhomboid family serine protease
MLIAGCAASSARSAFQLVKLHRTAPSETLQREQRDDSEVAAHVLRLAALRPRITWSLIALVSAVTLVQFATGIEHSVAAAALVKPAVRAGEWWRLLTASLLHGSIEHLLSNMLGLLVVGSMIELYDRAVRIPLIFVTGAVAGAVASTLTSSTASLGASGGIMGLVGYMVVAGGRRPGTPGFLRESMLRLMAVTAAFGVAMFFLIDNAGHAGGAVAGIGLGMLSIPRRAHPSSPAREQWLDRLSWFAAATLLAAALFTIARLVAR